MLHRLFSSGELGLLSSCGVQASHCDGFSCCRTLALGHVGFSCCGSWTLEHRLNSCGARAWWLCGLSEFPGSGIDPMSPALAGKFFNMEPPDKLQIMLLYTDTELLFEFPESYNKFRFPISFTYGNVSFHVTLSIHLILSSPLPCP